MNTRRRIRIDDGRAAVSAWSDGVRDEATVATAVRFTLEELAARAPGGGIEVRIPPFGVVQCGEGSRHVRGTPPRVVEADADTWLELAVGRVTWRDGIASGRVVASGVGSSIEPWLPVAAETDTPNH